MSLVTAKYSDFLHRHQSLFIGHAGQVTETDIIALAVYELKQLLHINSLEILLADGYWSISAEEDWISNLVGQDIQHYFNEMVIHQSCPNATFVLGGMLNVNVAQVATFKDGACDWYKGDDALSHTRQYFGRYEQKQRVLRFKSF